MLLTEADQLVLCLNKNYAGWTAGVVRQAEDARGTKLILQQQTLKNLTSRLTYLEADMIPVKSTHQSYRITSWEVFI